MDWNTLFTKPEEKKKKIRLIKYQMGIIREVLRGYEDKKSFNNGLIAGIILGLLTNALFAFSVEPLIQYLSIYVISIVSVILAFSIGFLIYRMNRENKRADDVIQMAKKELDEGQDNLDFLES